MQRPSDPLELCSLGIAKLLNLSGDHGSERVPTDLCEPH